MKQYDITDAKSHFSELVNLALQGEEVVIARENKPLLKLTPVPGAAKEQVKEATSKDLPDDLNEYSV